MPNEQSKEVVLRRVLDNGMTVVLKEDRRAPVAALHAWVKTGSIYEDEYAGTGISHFVEHMLFKGTERRGVGDIPNEIQAAGGDINAFTSYEHTVYTVNIPSDALDTGLDVLADALQHASFDAGEFSKEQEVILKEMNMNEDNPQRFLSRLFWATAFVTHPVQHPVIGYTGLFKGLAREDVVRYYKMRYVPNNIVLVAVGDFDAESTFEQIEKLFANFQRGRWERPVLPAEPRQVSARKVVDHRELGQAYVLLGFHGPSLTDADMAVMDVLSIILGEGKSSRLYLEAREKQALVNGVGSWSYTPSFPGVFALWASLQPDKIDPLRELFWREIDRLKDKPVRAEELEKAKAQTVHDYYDSLSTMAGQASDLGASEVMTKDPMFSRRYVRRVSQVTATDIQRVAKTYFARDGATEVFLLPKGVKLQEESAAQGILARADITRHELANGVRALIREDKEFPTVAIQVVFQGGLLVENAQNNGISHLFSEIFIAGTKDRSATGMIRDLERRGGRIENYSANNSFGFAMEVLSGDLDFALTLTDEILTRPALDPARFGKEKEAALLQVKALEDEVFQTASKLFRQTMFGDHPYRFISLGDEQSLRSLTHEDVVRFYREYVTGPNMLITVFGDVDTKDVLKKLNKIAGAMPSREPSFAPRPLVVHDTPRSAQKEQQGKQAMVLLGFPAASVYEEDRYTLEVMDAMFSGLGSRVFRSIRDTQGLAYMVGAYQMVGVDPGAFIFYVGTVPEGVDVVVGMLFAEIDRVRENGVDPEELTRAKQGLIGRHKIQLQKNSGLALMSALDELYGLGWEHYKEYERKISAVTNEDIVKAAHKYLNKNGHTLVVVRPPMQAAKKETQEVLAGKE